MTLESVSRNTKARPIVALRLLKSLSPLQCSNNTRRSRLSRISYALLILLTVLKYLDEKEVKKMTGNFGKLSPYEILNNLLPGILLCGSICWLFGIRIQIDTVFSAVFASCLVYTSGLIMSRVGSLLLAPIARETGFIVWSQKFYEVEERDGKLAILLRDMNMYRTLSTTFLFLTVLSIVSWISQQEQWSTWVWSFGVTFGLALTFVIFLFSYRKQSKAIYRRIERSAQ